MTRLSKSDAQLDAEAAAPLEERDLDAAILDHRAQYRTDLWIARLHVRDGETTSDSDPDRKKPQRKTNGWPRDLKQPFSPLFEALLEGRLGAFPYSSALLALRDNCRRTHAPKHTDRPEWNGSLCHSLTGMVIRLDYSLDMARLQLGLPNEGKTRRTLDNALLFLERRLEDSYWREQQAKPVERTPAEWMSEGHVHVGLPGLHAVDCPQCIKRRAA